MKEGTSALVYVLCAVLVVVVIFGTLLVYEGISGMRSVVPLVGGGTGTVSFGILERPAVPIVGTGTVSLTIVDPEGS